MYEKYKVIPIITHKKIILPISEEANSNWPREYNEYFDNNVTQDRQPQSSGHGAAPASWKRARERSKLCPAQRPKAYAL